MARHRLKRLKFGFLVSAFILLPGFSLVWLERWFVPAVELDDHWQRHQLNSTIVVDHSAWTRFLESHMKRGTDGVNRLAYAAIGEEDRQALARYLQALQATNVHALARGEQLAFWINLYNAATVRLVLDHPNIETIRDIKRKDGVFTIGPWDMELLEVDGRALSLHHIEHRIIRPIWRDARIHYALSCAAVGCPNLRQEAYLGADIEKQLEDQTRAYINDPRGVHFDRDGGLVLSKIYAWYVEDYGDLAGLFAHLKNYAAPDLAAKLERVERVDDYAYDWALNAWPPLNRQGATAPASE